MKPFRYFVFGLIIIVLPLMTIRATNETSYISHFKHKQHSDRGIYITYWTSRNTARFERIKAEAKVSGINTLVIDAKEILSQPIIKLAISHRLTSEAELKPDRGLVSMTDELHREGFIVTARIVTFKDDRLVESRPDLGVQLRSGGLYQDRKGGKWADPYSDEVRLYNELIAEEAALSGFDEVQFDYIRFPAEAEAQNAFYPFEKKDVTKVNIICSFLNAVRQRIGKYKVSIGVNIFGVTAWQSRYDVQNLGQDLKRMSKYIDVLSRCSILPISATVTMATTIPAPSRIIS